MQVTHLSNAFITVATAGQRLMCDPWAGTANHGGWHSFPEYAPQALHAAVADATLVYISHLYSDRFDPEFPRAADPLDRHFVIKQFDNGVLRRRLHALGVQRMTELAPFTVATYGDLRLVIVPQVTSNSSGLVDAIDYDLDTSLVVGDCAHTFFNQVDNPLSLADLGEVKRFIDVKFGTIDLACLVAGAAGEYPQCFLGIDRAAEAQRIVAGARTQLQAQVQLLQPRWVFPAGGTYFIPGALHGLNAHIAQPDHPQFAQAVQHSGGGAAVSAGRRLDDRPSRGNRQWHDHTAAPGRRPAAQPYRQHRRSCHRLIPPPTAGGAAAPPDAAAARPGAGQRHRVRPARAPARGRSPEPGQHARPPTLRFALPARSEDAARLGLLVHIDRLALQRCVQRLANWNQTLSGSLCLFERAPNVFDPGAVFSLNFLVA